MALSTIRRLTDEDNRRLNEAASRFAKNWGVDTSQYDSPYQGVEYTVMREGWLGNQRMVSAWRKAFARALREKPCKSLAVGYGYVGYHVD